MLWWRHVLRRGRVLGRRMCLGEGREVRRCEARYGLKLVTQGWPTSRANLRVESLVLSRFPIHCLSSKVSTLILLLTCRQLLHA